MAISFFQKIRLVLRGWQRRREERDKTFVQRNVSWVQPPPAKAAAPQQPKAPARVIDMEGLQVAFLDDSGRIAHYLDVHDLKITDPVALERELNQIAGVVTVGLFAARAADVLLVGTAHGVETR